MFDLARSRLLPLGGLLAACSATGVIDGHPDTTFDAAPPPPKVSWYRDIQPLVAGHCQGCHVAGGIAPFALTDYDADHIAQLAPGMLMQVEAGNMPPWSAVSTDACAPRLGWKGDPRLGPDEVALLRAWVDDGAPAGDPASAPVLPEPPSLHLSGVTEEVAPAKPFTTKGDHDQLICFALGEARPSDGWLTGIELVPGNPTVVHHALLFVVPPAGTADLASRLGPDGNYDCFSGVGSPGAYLASVWVPGSLPFEAPEGAGVPVPAGSRLVVQVHYHPAGKTQDPDSTSAALRVVATAPGMDLGFAGFGNKTAPPELQPGPDDQGGVEFRIPAGVAGHTETIVQTVSRPGLPRQTIVSLFPHMHYVGVDLQATITRASPPPGEPASECLIDSRWNFDWQRTYQYAAADEAAPTLGDGDVITLRCTYDNTVANPFVVRALDEQNLSAPIDVSFGQETLDEMCALSIGVL